LAVEKSTVTNNIKSLPAPDKTNPYIKTICGNDDGTMDENALDVQKRFKAARGNKEIDFYGLSAYQLFPGLFDAIEELLQKVKSYAKPIRTGISDLIDNIIRAIKEEINNLRQIIDVIERIIQFIEDFLNLNGVSLLALDTTNGTYGLVNQLQNAQGFQGQGTNKEMFFAGIMVGVGYPGLGDTNNVFTNVGAVFEAQKSRIEGSANDLDKLNTKAVNNATEAFNKFSQFFK
jgi:methyl-accepting chemotaxis protein